MFALSYTKATALLCLLAMATNSLAAISFDNFLPTTAAQYFNAAGVRVNGNMVPSRGGLYGKGYVLNKQRKTTENAHIWCFQRRNTAIPDNPADIVLSKYERQYSHSTERPANIAGVIAPFKAESYPCYAVRTCGRHFL
ncbi:hypothetical protein SYNPS1DRAFT_29895 [Syncephalis pseudoplumigaleata]|uniref:Uncharacterized protein n=1 Tax=Syncephalis pseudoplumigaleata TaxID=1712513 RepID=A0A4P9YWM6_9FUNG|nr:hypothetical protein SYNPS1DRAFT_29895 [Syncephalis pseudoplumigaleata]|eukprot:RKP24334.1 hypothetical protein SYNPS1DRAFT_29895 [Syncephalis pseudoplumigaleata]